MREAAPADGRSAARRREPGTKHVSLCQVCAVIAAGSCVVPQLWVLSAVCVAAQISRKIGHFLVLPVRIELTTSPLPRGCSTTELRQQIIDITLKFPLVSKSLDIQVQR